MGNLITTVAGFALASKGNLDIRLFFFTLLGLGSIIASACVFNNYIDRKADRKMERTKNRALARGIISHHRALFFAIFLGISGALILGIYTHLLALSIALLGFVIYVVLYSFWKYKTTYATVVGSVSGALPPVIGYCAVSQQLDKGALLLFALLFFWQMPHFYAIAMYRLKDYSAASIPVLPVKKGIFNTKIEMLLYIVAFIGAELLLFFYGYVGSVYLIVTSLLSLVWISLSIQGFRAKDDKIWAKKMFRVSLVVINALCLVISFDTV